jgi:hypothetical protein
MTDRDWLGGTVRDRSAVRDADVTRQREVVDAFLAAARHADLDALQAVLDPGVVLRADRGVVPSDALGVVRGARDVAKQALRHMRLARVALPALVSGSVGLVTIPRGGPFAVIRFTVTSGSILEIDIVAEPNRLRELDLAVFDEALVASARAPAPSRAA